MAQDFIAQRRAPTALVRVALTALCAWSVFVAIPAQAATTVDGIFALIGGKQEVAGELVATPAATPTDLKLDISFHRVAETNALKRYDTELNRQMHVIAISDDLTVFMHHHVAHVIDGHGQLRMTFPQPGLYHIFVDAAPKTIGQQVMRFDLNVGADQVTPLAARPLGVSDPSVKSGLYTVVLEQLTLKADEPGQLKLHIAEYGKPAKDLHAYLGVAAHIVMIGADSLGYAHSHAGADVNMDMSGMAMEKRSGVEPAGAPEPESDGQPVPADLTLHVPALPAGPYKLWVQFIGGRTLHTVPFVATVK